MNGLPDSRTATAAIDERDRNARLMLIERADVTPDEVIAAAATLSKMGGVNLDDLLKPPGFDLLPDGSVARANTDAPEWSQWAAVQDLVDASRRLGWQLTRAYSESDVPAGGTAPSRPRVVTRSVGVGTTRHAAGRFSVEEDPRADTVTIFEDEFVNAMSVDRADIEDLVAVLKASTHGQESD